jgi:O-antigen/teichoic acid export membrane protein
MNFMRVTVHGPAMFYRARKKVIGSTLILLFDRVLGVILNIVVLAALVKSYGPADFGKWSYVQTAVQMAAPFLALGAEPILMRELVRKPLERTEILGSAALMLFCASILVSVFPLAFIALVNTGDSELLRLATLMTLANIPNAILVIEAAFKAEMRPLPIVIARSLALTTSAAVKITLCLWHVSISYIGAATAIEAVVLGGVLIATYQASGHQIARWQVNRDRIIFLGRQCLPAMASAVVVMLFFRINHLLLAGVASFDEVGRYALAFSAVQFLGLLPWAASTSLYPNLVRLHETDPAAFRQNVGWMFWLFSLLGYLATACLMLVAPFLEPMLSAKYHGVGAVLIAMSLNTVFTYSATARAQVINITNATHLHFISSLAGLAVLLPTSLLLIPKWGAVGAAIGVTVATFISGIVTTAFLPQVRSIARLQLRALALLPPPRMPRREDASPANSVRSA